MSGSITSTTTSSGIAGQSQNTLAGDMGMFLTLLTTQLKAQDPTAPLDANQLTQQLVQFATVEQQINQTQALHNLLELQQAAQLTSAAPLLGTEVEVESDQLPLQDGEAEILLPAAASGTMRSAIVTVTDSAGRTLRQEEVALGSTPQRWSWDGRGPDGVQIPDGAYGVTVTGVKDNGETEALAFSVFGTVTGASMASSGPAWLMLGSLGVEFSKLRAIGVE
jgi:flagellar basal-body rod modification protein FlgD